MVATLIAWLLAGVSIIVLALCAIGYIVAQMEASEELHAGLDAVDELLQHEAEEQGRRTA